MKHPASRKPGAPKPDIPEPDIPVSDLREQARRTGKLPERPSALLRLALDDMAGIRNHSHYYFRSNSPIFYPTSHSCALDLAGCVLVGTFEAPLMANNDWGKEPFLSTYAPFLQNEKALYALDYFTSGQISGALSYMGVSGHAFEDRRMHLPHGDSRDFDAAMDCLVQDLAKAGL